MVKCQQKGKIMFTLPKLNYEYTALEPYIDAKTMEIHHTKHHQVYVDKLNSVIEKYPELAGKSLENLLTELNVLNIPDADKTQIKNHGGGHHNHTLFWQIMDPANTKNTELIQQIIKTINSVDEFKKQFTDSALKVFGSGWAWLVKDSSGALKIIGLPNQDSPLSLNLTPIIGLDVWEHAYYLKYQNKRVEYIENWWNVLKLI
jgi:superoxide dismutase, Fe-Mn family